MLIDENSDKLYGRDLLPDGGRHLMGTNESYEYQLSLNLDMLIKQCIKQYRIHGEIHILDIGGNDSPAIQELKHLLNTRCGIPTGKVHLAKIDLMTIQNIDGVHFMQGDISDDDFIIRIIKELGISSQSVIFMNQVLQYVGDKFKIIKLIVEQLLEDNGVFYFNIVNSSIYTGDHLFSIVQDALEKIWNEENEGLDIVRYTKQKLSNTSIYHVRRQNGTCSISMPMYRRVIQERVDGLKISAYFFLKRMMLPTNFTREYTRQLLLKNI